MFRVNELYSSLVSDPAREIIAHPYLDAAETNVQYIHRSNLVHTDPTRNYRCLSNVR